MHSDVVGTSESQALGRAHEAVTAAPSRHCLTQGWPLWAMRTRSAMPKHGKHHRGAELPGTVQTGAVSAMSEKQVAGCEGGVCADMGGLMPQQGL